MSDPAIYRWDPAWAPKTARISPLGGGTASVSAYTGSTRASVLPKTPWVASFTFAPSHEPDWIDIEAMIDRLDGQSNYVRLFHPLRVLPRGVACGINRYNPNGLGLAQFSDGTTFSDGTHFVDGGTRARLARTHYRGERAVKLAGLIASQALSVMTGDMMEIAGYLYRSTANVASDVSGQALVPIRPSLRIDVPAGSYQNYVEFAYATSPFMLAKVSQGIDIDAPDLGSMGYDFVEALP